MKTRLLLAFAAIALTFGATTAPAQQGGPNQCNDFCSRVRCAAPTVCGLYTDANGDKVCGCH
jgi:hypothetical protein